MREAHDLMMASQVAMINRGAKATSSNGRRYKFSKPDQLYDYQDAIDQIRSSFEEDYVSPNQTIVNGLTIDEIIKRQHEWRRMQSANSRERRK
ncbi:hypothetical protein [Limosilactobacillus gorillae]|uniref:hypothetical protein n=1 Tax=Limosilactobacillus gorillae TaxID=1450649 RepID=UPI000A51CB03|nr:hypothetical protein [Limosilactobacillus gorillae]